MNKKVLMINGSGRKINTYNILLQAEKILKTKNIDVEIIHLFDYEIKDCVGCEVCVTKEGCCIPDDMPKLMQKIMESDGVILGSPVYRSSVTSKFKTFVDRTNIWVHKPETAGIPMMSVAVTAATGLKEIKRFFDSFETGIGARRGGFISRKEKEIKKPVREKEISRFLSLLNKDKSAYRPAMSEIIMFNVGKVLALKSSGDDKRFWEENKLLGLNYYYPCRMSFIKKTFSKFMFRVLTKAMK